MATANEALATAELTKHAHVSLNAVQLLSADDEHRAVDARVRAGRRQKWKGVGVDVTSGIRGWYEEGNFVMITDPGLAAIFARTELLGDRLAGERASAALPPQRFPLPFCRGWCLSLCFRRHSF